MIGAWQGRGLRVYGFEKATKGCDIKRRHGTQLISGIYIYISHRNRKGTRDCDDGAKRGRSTPTASHARLWLFTKEESRGKTMIAKNEGKFTVEVSQGLEQHEGREKSTNPKNVRSE